MYIRPVQNPNNIPIIIIIQQFGELIQLFVAPSIFIIGRILIHSNFGIINISAYQAQHEGQRTDLLIQRRGRKS
jgi:hypothetical protein